MSSQAKKHIRRKLQRLKVTHRRIEKIVLLINSLDSYNVVLEGRLEFLNKLYWGLQRENYYLRSDLFAKGLLADENEGYCEESDGSWCKLDDGIGFMAYEGAMSVGDYEEANRYFYN